MAEFINSREYEDKLDPRLYLETYFHLESGTLANNFIRFQEENLHKVFSSGKVKGKTLVDVGTAPCIQQLLPACKAFDEIITTWHTKRELRELQKWQNREADAFDWSSIVKYVCELEGNGITVKEKEEKLRGKIKQTLFCDVSQSNPLAPTNVPKVDCVTATGCLEAACRNYEAYSLALKNISNLLNPSGHLLIVGDLGTNYFEVGAQKVLSLSVSEKFLKDVISKNNYHIVELATFSRPKAVDAETSDRKGFYFLHAQKV
ncbi:nicotinamide N-methyltransferase-like [Hyperolius riggenbachi]|uniref:nicotinamide N-methyltransferase-like n=1 Tax=Hyperolius riggenbachi TaxID=752182 RepID=UPI0035A37B2F